MAMDVEGIIQIGTISKPHGVRGELKVFSQTDDPLLYEELEDVIIPVDGCQKKYRIEKARDTQKHWLFKFEGVDTMDEAERLRGKGIYTEESHLKPLDEDEFFIHDLVGSKVYSVEDVYLGTITNYFEAGTQGVCEVESEKGDFLFPTSAEVLQEVIPPDKVIIQPVPELLDLNKKKKD